MLLLMRKKAKYAMSYASIMGLSLFRSHRCRGLLYAWGDGANVGEGGGVEGGGVNWNSGIDGSSKKMR